MTMDELQEKRALMALAEMIHNVDDVKVHDVLSLMVAVLIMHSHYIHDERNDC